MMHDFLIPASLMLLLWFQTLEPYLSRESSRIFFFSFTILKFHIFSLQCIERITYFGHITCIPFHRFESLTLLVKRLHLERSWEGRIWIVLLKAKEVHVQMLLWRTWITRLYPKAFKGLTTHAKQVFWGPLKKSRFSWWCEWVGEKMLLQAKGLLLLEKWSFASIRYLFVDRLQFKSMDAFVQHGYRGNGKDNFPISCPTPSFCIWCGRFSSMKNKNKK